MFIGHYGPAIWDTHRTNGIKLWHGFLAVQAMDLVFCILGLIGLEGGPMPDAPHPLAFNIPYSHSLVGAGVIALSVASLYRLLYPTTGRKGAMIMGALAFSHWPLDALVHRPDLPLYPGSDVMLGLGWWDYAWPTYALEVVLLAGMMAWWLRQTTGPVWTSIVSWTLVVILCGLQFIAITAPTLMVKAGTFDRATMPSPAVGALQGLGVFVLTIAAIAWVERKRGTQ